MTLSGAPALRRRRSQQERAVTAARTLADAARLRLPLRGVAVFGSYARGDFHDLSDIDVLVVIDGPLPARQQERLALLEPRPPGVHPLVWTPQELIDRRRRRDLIAVEALERGIWVLGSSEHVWAGGDEPPGAHAPGG